jgi:catechol 2,3-dioxygenase-like lactoylglutathione lyase family enzyme
MEPIARFAVVALDCPDARALASFYSQITGWEVDDGGEDDDWVELVAPGGGVTIAFQEVADHRPPDWPGSERPQQAHIDFDVADLDDGEAKVLAIGARKADVQPGEYFRVFLDPAGHPFCLVRAGSST